MGITKQGVPGQLILRALRFSPSARRSGGINRKTAHYTERTRPGEKIKERAECFSFEK